MSLSIVFWPPETRPNGRTYTSFEITNDDGSIKGEVGVPAGQPDFVLLETKRCLRELFEDALTELDGWAPGAESATEG
jgi:hypothetical protein